MDLNFDRNRIDKVPLDVVIEELKAAAKHYGYRKFSGREFDRVSTRCKRSVVFNNFKTWEKALAATGLTLKPYPRKPRKDLIPESDLFNELERVWQVLGHRPSRNEWEASNPRYSYTTYKSRFDGWINACATFVDFMSRGTLLEPSNSAAVAADDGEEELWDRQTQEEKRNIPLKLRLQVLSRDNFKCVYCGKSPATNVGTVLHIDHVDPFSKGGKTHLDNLQTLCEECNLGKGNAL